MPRFVFFLIKQFVRGFCQYVNNYHYAAKGMRSYGLSYGDTILNYGATQQH